MLRPCFFQRLHAALLDSCTVGFRIQSHDAMMTADKCACDSWMKKSTWQSAAVRLLRAVGYIDLPLQVLHPTQSTCDATHLYPRACLVACYVPLQVQACGACAGEVEYVLARCIC